MTLADALFGGWRWYRRLIGGHWENWWLDTPATWRWYRMPWGCANLQSGGTATRPAGAHGTPECETWS